MAAAKLQEGWAYVRDGERLILLRPPYKVYDQTSTDEPTLEAAVSRYGYQPMNREFEDWEPLVEFLEEQAIKTRRALGYPPPRMENIRGLIRFATKEMAHEILARVEKELIPGHELITASGILADLQELDAVKSDPELPGRIQFLLKQTMSKSRISWSRHEVPEKYLLKSQIQTIEFINQGASSIQPSNH
ncbi:MAG TPA: hypothetical protein VM658_13055 [bacterium]|nr:hypothetical protein [bacterium]